MLFKTDIKLYDQHRHYIYIYNFACLKYFINFNYVMWGQKTDVELKIKLNYSKL